jgi:enamine deaminase RidA (YjgF/YER057c/UK114 family)
MKYLFITVLILFSMTQTIAQKRHNPAGLFDPKPYAFSHVAVIPAGSKLIYVAGQGGEEDTTGKLSASFRTQVQFALKNIQTALQSQGATMKSVFKVTTLIVDHNGEKLKILIEEFKKMWPDQQFPINTLIPVPALALEGMLVEIEATAAVKE